MVIHTVVSTLINNVITFKKHFHLQSFATRSQPLIAYMQPCYIACSYKCMKCFYFFNFICEPVVAQWHNVPIGFSIGGIKYFHFFASIARQTAALKSVTRHATYLFFIVKDFIIVLHLNYQWLNFCNESSFQKPLAVSRLQQDRRR